MSLPKFYNRFDELTGLVAEAVVELAEFLFPSLKEYLSWDFSDDTNLLSIHDEEDDVREKIMASEGIRGPCLSERGVFVRHAAGAA